MTNSINFYFDFISPYSYIAHKQIEKIQKKKEIKLILFGILNFQLTH